MDMNARMIVVVMRLDINGLKNIKSHKKMWMDIPEIQNHSEKVCNLI